MFQNACVMHDASEWKPTIPKTNPTSSRRYESKLINVSLPKLGVHKTPAAADRGELHPCASAQAHGELWGRSHLSDFPTYSSEFSIEQLRRVLLLLRVHVCFCCLRASYAIMLPIVKHTKKTNVAWQLRGCYSRVQPFAWHKCRN